MSLFSPWVLLLAAGFSAPAWTGVWNHTMTIDGAAGRTLLAWLVTGLAVALIGRLVHGYATAATPREGAEPKTPSRRRDDPQTPDADPRTGPVEHPGE